MTEPARETLAQAIAETKGKIQRLLKSCWNIRNAGDGLAFMAAAEDFFKFRGRFLLDQLNAIDIKNLALADSASFSIALIGLIETGTVPNVKIADLELLEYLRGTLITQQTALDPTPKKEKTDEK